MPGNASDIRAGGAFIEIGGKDVGFKKLAKEVDVSLKGQVISFAKVAASFTVLTSVIAVPLIKLTNDFVKFAYGVQLIGRKIGVSAGDMSKLAYAATMTGVTLENVGFAVKFLERNIAMASGTGVFDKVLKRLGISLEDLKGKQPTEQVLLLADALSKIKDRGEATAISMQLFGKGGMLIIPMLIEGSEGMRRQFKSAKELGVLLDEDTTKSVVKFRDALVNFKQSILGIGGAIAKGALSPLTMFVEKFTGMSIAIRKLIEQNPKLIGQLVYIGRLLGIVAIAFAAIGTAILALSSPFLWLTATLSSIALYFLDKYKVIDTGFSDTVNKMTNSFTVFGGTIKQWWDVIEGYSLVAINTIALSMAQMVGRTSRQMQQVLYELGAFLTLPLAPLALPGAIKGWVTGDRTRGARIFSGWGEAMTGGYKERLGLDRPGATENALQAALNLAADKLGIAQSALAISSGKPPLRSVLGGLLKTLKGIFGGIWKAPPFPTLEHPKVPADEEVADSVKRTIRVTSFYGGFNPYEHMGGARDVARDQLGEQRKTNRLLGDILNATEEGGLA